MPEAQRTGANGTRDGNGAPASVRLTIGQALTKSRMKLTTERVGFYLCCVLSAAPLLFAHYPPMVDLPQHAAQIATLNNLSRPDFAYKDLFTLEWARPYLGGYLVIWALSQVVSVLTAVKISIALTVITIPMTAALLRAHFNADPRWDWLLLTIGYGFAFQWGLVNFFVGAPIVLLFLVSAFRYADAPSARSGWWLALFAYLLLTVHLLIAAFGCGLACLYILSGRGTWKARLVAALPLASPIPAALAYLAWVISSTRQANEAGPWGLSIFRPVQLMTSALGLPLTVANIAVAALVFALPFVLGARLTRDRPRLVIFAAYLAWMMLGPNYFLGNYFTYQRFSLFCMPMFLIVLTDPVPRPALSSALKLAQGLVFALPLTLVVVACFLFAGFDQESRGYREIAKAMKPGKRVLGLMINNASVAFDQPMYLHYASWYQAEQRGVADFSFAQFGLLVSYRPGADVPIPRGFEWYPRDIRLATA